MAWFRRLWHKAFFSEMNPIITLGAQRSLQPADLLALPANLDPRTTVFMESKIDWSSGPALLKSLMRVSRRDWILPLGFYMANAAMNLSSPILVNHFVKRMQAGVQTPHA